MKLPESLRSLVLLVVGLAIGGAGAVLFSESMPGAEGSPEERANKLELELKRAQNQVAALEAMQTTGSGAARDRATGRTFADEARRIADDLREGRPVTPDDLFRTTKPLLRDLAPFFDRIRLRQQQEVIDSMTGELARKYDLTPQNQAALKQWFGQKADEEAKRWSELIAADETRLEDVVRASHDVRPDEGVEAFMKTILPADKLAAFTADRLAERAERVQSEADAKVQRLDAVVGLDESQRDLVFGMMARSSREYDPAMVLEGSQGEIGMTPGGDPYQAMTAILRPDQRAAYEAERKRRREEAMKDAAAIGLTLPPSWDMLDRNF